MIQAAMTPTNVFLVLLPVVLGVNDQNVASANKFDHLLFLLFRVFEGSSIFWSADRLAVPPIVRLVIGKKANRAARSEEPITHARARVMREAGFNPHCPDVEAQILEFL